MQLTIGTKLTIGSKTYEVTGKQKNSLILTDSQGKHGTMTLARIKTITGINYVDCVPAESELSKMVKTAQIFNKAIKMPTNASECEYFFEQIEGWLSPEHLFCDGEISRSAAMRKAAGYKKAWKELEKIAGKKRQCNESF